ncbi:50S ribosomal protein L24 [Mycoplasmatota bacterium]|nr:50S ribosomal protein L24 [Mycoplasmatota bacterium]
MKIKKGDTVVVLSGKDKGKVASVTKVLAKNNKVIVEGVNIVKKHQKPSQANPDGGIIEFAAPIDASNVAIQDPKTKEATRVGYKLVDGKKVRYAKKSGELLN